MKCPYCGTENDQGNARFCRVCGKPLPGSEARADEPAGSSEDAAAAEKKAESAEAHVKTDEKAGDKPEKAKAAPGSVYDLLYSSDPGTILMVWSTLYLWANVISGKIVLFFPGVISTVLCLGAFLLGKGGQGERSHLVIFNLIVSIIELCFMR